MEVPKVEAPNEVPNPGGPKGFGDEVQTKQNSIFKTNQINRNL